MTSVSPTPDDVLLKRYEKEIDLYKFYFEIAVKGSLFAFGVTGALLSYFFSKPEDPLVVWALAVPIMLNFGFLVLFSASIKESKKMNCDHEQTCEQLNNVVPFDMTPLSALCKIFSCMYALVTVGLVIVVVVYGALT